MTKNQAVRSDAAQQREPISDARTGRAPQLIEEGNAFRQLGEVSAQRPQRAAVEHFDVIVIGAGQAGLSAGYHLARRGLRFVILNGDQRVGDTWRKRWDSLRLFTPARLDSLDGMPFPAAGDYFPTKDEFADYLESYAARFALPVRCGVKVERVHKRDDGTYVVDAGEQRFEAAHVLVAMSGYQNPKVPDYASELDPGITQFHSAAYRNPSQLKPGPVLLIGAGNSGSELAVEIGRTHKVYMAGRDTGFVPFEIRSWLGRNVLSRLLLRVVFHRILTTSTPMGRKARPNLIAKGGPLIRVKPAHLAAVGVERTARMTSVGDGKPVLEDGRTLDVANVIWCCGYHPAFSFIDLPVFGEDGQPRHERGVVTGESGLYFIGLAFTYSYSSTMVHGVGRDAAYIAKAISARQPRKLAQVG